MDLEPGEGAEEVAGPDIVAVDRGAGDGGVTGPSQVGARPVGHFCEAHGLEVGRAERHLPHG
jgi:hypothetical protein